MLTGRLCNRLYLILAFWLGANQFLILAVTPLIVTMVQTHLCLRCAWTPARQLPGSAPSSLPFNPALACWLLPNTLGVMLSPQHLRGRFCTYLCNQLSGLGSLLTVPEYCYPFRLNESHAQINYTMDLVNYVPTFTHLISHG